MISTFLHPKNLSPRGGPERSSKGGVKTGNNGRRPGAEKQRVLGKRRFLEAFSPAYPIPSMYGIFTYTDCNGICM